MQKIFLFTLLFLSATLCHGQTTEQMVNACATVSVQAHAPTPTKRHPEQITKEKLNNYYCLGAFSALQDVIMIPSDSFPVCADPSVTELQLIEVFLKYAREHPAQYHFEFTYVALVSYQVAFPCKIKEEESRPNS